MRKLSYCIRFSMILLLSSLLVFAEKIERQCGCSLAWLREAQSENAIKSPLLIDSLVAGLDFAIANDEIKWYNGDFFYLDLELPAFRKVVFGYEDIDTVMMIPVEKRRFLNDPLISIVKPSFGQAMYQRMMEIISSERLKINFYQLYQSNKHILHKALSKEQYDERYLPMVNVLLRAYVDLEQDSTLMPTIEYIMKEHEEEMLKGNLDQDLSSAYGKIKNNLPQSAVEEYIEPNPISVVWCYSFWLRRMHENKTEDIYRTLLAIQSDYGYYDIE